MRANRTLILIALSMLFFSSCKKSKFRIGRNYQGGIIAYVDASGEHGLIAAPNDQCGFGGALPEADWGYTNGTSIPGADGTTIGTGAQNTLDIMNGCSTAGIAARICGDLELGGYSDWYLPSKDELNQLFLNKISIGGFSEQSSYWSSSEVGTDNAWIQYFLEGEQISLFSKDYTFNVRAVRSF